MKRFELSWDDGLKEYSSYQAAFKFYMKLREDIGFTWLYIYDNQKKVYCICENCSCK